MERLADYLRRITAGEHALDVRDNGEGELSILKSEIYKVTVMLGEYNDQLQAEKLQLADSLADISHQLKTPLTSMLMMTDLLSGEDLPGRQAGGIHPPHPHPAGADPVVGACTDCP